MNKKVEVIIGSYPDQISLDLSDNAVSIALQYSIDDVRNIDKKNTNHSKTITVPGTKKNNKAFGSLFDINTTFDQFNPNLKTKAMIVVDSSPVLEGYLQLTKVNKLNNADLQGNNITYEVIVFDDSIDFIQTLGDKMLVNNSDSAYDLDFTSFNHTYNQTNITNAWSSTYDVIPYQYPLLDNLGSYTTKDFKPSFYHKALLLKIAEGAGYTLEGSFIDNEGADPLADDYGTYHKELIMWDGDTPKISDTLAATREFNAGVSSTSVVSLGTYSHNTLVSLNNKITNYLNYDDITSTGHFDNTAPNYTFNNSGGSYLDYCQWECNNTGEYEFNIVGDFSLKYSKQDNTQEGSPFVFSEGNYTDVKAGLLIELIDSNSVIYGSTLYTLGDFNELPSGVNSGEFTGDINIKIPTSKTIPIGTYIIPRISIHNDKAFYWGYTVSPRVLQMPVDIELSWNRNTNAEFFNKAIKEENIEDGDEIEIGQYLPKEIKQKDIVTDIVKRYNVYIKKHPTKDKTLVLESRDDYYKNNVTVLDWTQKKDYSSKDDIKFLSDLQSKEILFTYKEANDLKGAGDSDFYNKFYQASTGDIYGQKLISFDNDFVKGVNKIESIFSTAPLTFRSHNNVVVPSIRSTEGKRKPVLCYWGGLVDVKDEKGVSKSFSIKWGTASETTYTTYPYAGHYDNPYTPTLDIHFGEVTYEYYNTLSAITNNNLFNRYWRNQQKQISEGKLITSKLYLKETDINFIKDRLNSKVFIKDSYYTINKIVDYKPLEDGLTTVELLRVEDVTLELPTYTPIAVLNSTETFISTLNDSRTGPFRSSVTNSTASPNVMMLGQRNYIGSNVTGLVNGNDNSVFDNSSNINITGDNNTVGAGLKNVTIVGDNQTVTESNTSIINGNTLNNTTALASERISQELEIGSWDMDLITNVGVSHSLSATEWGTIRNVEVSITDDANTFYQPLENGGLFGFSSSSFSLQRTASGTFDNSNYDDSTINRGFITFTYLPD